MKTAEQESAAVAAVSEGKPEGAPSPVPEHEPPAARAPRARRPRKKKTAAELEAQAAARRAKDRERKRKQRDEKKAQREARRPGDKPDAGPQDDASPKTEGPKGQPEGAPVLVGLGQLVMVVAEPMHMGLTGKAYTPQQRRAIVETGAAVEAKYADQELPVELMFVAALVTPTLLERWPDVMSWGAGKLGLVKPPPAPEA